MLPVCNRWMRRAAALGTLCLSLGAAAQGYPVKPVRMLVPFAPGGVSDLVARLVTPHMSQALGQPIVVENRVGAGGVIATEVVAKSAPDGYTLLTAFDSFAANPYLYPSATYDPVKDFSAIGQAVRSQIILVVNPKLGVKTLGDLLRASNARKGSLTYASAGAGTSSHLIAELLKLTTGIEATAIHYKGGAPAIADLLSGQVDMMVSVMSTALPHVRAGKLTAVAVTSSSRTPLLPGVPTVAESHPGFEAYSWVGFVAAAGTPRPIVARLNAETNRAVGIVEVREKLETLGFDTTPGTPEKFAEWIASESARWSRVIRERHITIE
jgi:tripartite-type tricarboxylate transporter receptor subunit TctC